MAQRLNATAKTDRACSDCERTIVVGESYQLAVPGTLIKDAYLSRVFGGGAVRLCKACSTKRERHAVRVARREILFDINGHHGVA